VESDIFIEAGELLVGVVSRDKSFDLLMESDISVEAGELLVGVVSSDESFGLTVDSDTTGEAGRLLIPECRTITAKPQEKQKKKKTIIIKLLANTFSAFELIVFGVSELITFSFNLYSIVHTLFPRPTDGIQNAENFSV
jgi:hypothetical protein